MTVWHLARSWESACGIIDTGCILANGRNVAVRTDERFAHVSTKPFPRVCYIFDWLGAYEAWEFEVEISNPASLIPDLSGECDEWLVSREDLIITRINYILYIEDTFAWVAGHLEPVRVPLKHYGARRIFMP